MASDFTVPRRLTRAFARSAGGPSGQSHLLDWKRRSNHRKIGLFDGKRHKTDWSGRFSNEKRRADYRT